ncbi:MAG TPA: DUF4129 domain-containing protein [Thermomicrobiales bacterium]|nr:DUF4129 domain-containing protein [Thermomicrobiales bacterium]
MFEQAGHAQEPESQVPLTFGDLIRRLDWRVELLSIAIILAEACLVWLLAGLVMAEDVTRSTYPFLVIALAMLASHYVVYLLDQGRIWSPEYEIIMTTSIILTLLIAIKAGSFAHIPVYDFDWISGTINGLAFFDTEATRPVWGNVVLIAYAWFRARSREEPSLDSAYTMLRWGTLALGGILLIIVIGADSEFEIRERLSAGVLGFYVFSLAAIGLARMRLEGFRSAGPLGARWLATFATPILVIVMIAVIGAGLFSRRFLETLLWALSPLLFVLSVIFQIIVLVIAIIAFLILTPIFWLIGDVEPETTNATATPAGELEAGAEQTQPDPFVIPEALQYLIAAIVLVAIISLLTRYLYRRRARQRTSTLEERESVLDWSDILGSLGGKLRSLFQRPPALDPYAALRGDPRWQYTIHIRERYRELQGFGEELGRGRRPRETAEEYRPALAQKLASDNRPAVDALTRIYRRARYSGQPATERDALEMDQSWERAREAPRPDGAEPA